jgi:hypothetical protein
VVDLLVPASAVFASGLVSRQPEGMILPEPIAFVVAAGIVLGFAPQLHSVSKLHVKLSNVLRGLSLVSALLLPVDTGRVVVRSRGEKRTWRLKNE